MSLAKELKKQGKSIYWIAKNTGISYTTVYHLAAGTQDPGDCHYRTLKAIASALNTTVDSVFSPEEKTITRIDKRKRDQVRECIKLAKNFPKVQRLIVFGSAVNGHCTDESGLDISVELNASPSGRDYHDFSAAIDKACGHNCDLILYNQRGAKLRHEIDQTGVIVYEL